MSEEKSNSPFYKKWWFWLIVGVLVIGAIGSAMGVKPNEETQTNEEQTQENTTQENSTEITKSDAEDKCQDAGFLGKYLNVNELTILDAFGAPTQFDAFGGWVDNDGKPVYRLVWHGKYKETKQVATFTCWVSGEKDNIHIHYLELDSVPLFDTKAATIKDTNGNYIFAEDYSE